MGKYDLESLGERGASIASSLGMQEIAYSSHTIKERINDGLQWRPTIEKLLLEHPEDISEMLRRFFGQDVGEREPYFPNGNVLGEFAVRTLNTPYFRPTKIYSGGDLLKDVIEIERRFGTKKMTGIWKNSLKGDLLPEIVENIKEAVQVNCAVPWYDLESNAINFGWCPILPHHDLSWWAARETAKKIICELAEFTSRSSIEDIEEAKGRTGRADDPFETVMTIASIHASGSINHIIGECIPERTKRYPDNPFSPLTNIYERGLCPIGISEQRDSFVIWQPPIVRLAEDSKH